MFDANVSIVVDRLLRDVKWSFFHSISLLVIYFASVDTFLIYFLPLLVSNSIAAIEQFTLY